MGRADRPPLLGFRLDGSDAARRAFANSVRMVAFLTSADHRAGRSNLRARFNHALGYRGYSKGSYCLLGGIPRKEDTKMEVHGMRLRTPRTPPGPGASTRFQRLPAGGRAALPTPAARTTSSAGPDGAGGYRGRWWSCSSRTVLFGAAYMAAIKPFRYVIVYLALMRQIGREWRRCR